MLRATLAYQGIRRGIPVRTTAREALEAARSLVANPFGVSLDAMSAAFDGDEPRIKRFRLAYVWPGQESSLQASIIQDDRGRWGLLAVVNGAAVAPDKPRQGQLVFSAAEAFRLQRHRVPHADAILEPLVTAAMPPTEISVDGVLPLLLGGSGRYDNLTLDGYRRERRRLQCNRMFVEAHHDLIEAYNRSPEAFREELGVLQKYLGTLDTSTKERLLDNIRRVVPFTQDAAELMLSS